MADPNDDLAMGLDGPVGIESEETTRLRKERQLAINRQAQQRHREKRKAREVNLMDKIENLEKTLTESSTVKEENQRLRTYLELVVRHSDLLQQELELKNMQLNTLKPGSVPPARPRELPIPPSGLKEVLALTRRGEGADLGLPAPASAVLESRSMVAAAAVGGGATSSALTVPPSFTAMVAAEDKPDLDLVKRQNLTEFMDTLHAHGKMWSPRGEGNPPPTTTDAEEAETLYAHYHLVCRQLRSALQQHLAKSPGMQVHPGSEILRLLGECKLIFAKCAVMKNTSLRDENLKASNKNLIDGTDVESNDEESTSIWLKCVVAMKLVGEQITTLLRIRHSHLEDLTAIYDHRRLITRHAMQLAESLSMFVRGVTTTGITPEVWESHTVMKGTLEDIANSLSDEQELFKKFHLATWGVLTPLQSAIFITEVEPIYPDMLALVNSISYIQQQHQEGQAASLLVQGPL